MSILRVANLQFNASGTKRIDYDAVADDGIIKISAEAVRFPVGSNGTRPPSEPGLIRYNSDVGYMEFGGPTQWIQVASNSVYDVANASYAATNVAYNASNAAFNAASNAVTQTSKAFDTANAAFTSANNVGPQIAPAFNQANTAFNVANAAYGSANNALPLAGGTMTGLIIGKVSTGNVYTSNDGGNFSIRGDSANAAVISFHRPAAYAVNMGLDTDNNFRIGGWSDGLTYRLQLAGPGGTHIFNGNLSVTGSLDLSNTTSHLKLPIGTTAQRPSGTSGMVRFNSTTGFPEWYDTVTSAWVQIDNNTTLLSGTWATMTDRNPGGSWTDHLASSSFTVPTGRYGLVMAIGAVHGCYESGNGQGAGRIQIRGPSTITGQECWWHRGQFSNFAGTGSIGHTAVVGAGTWTVYMQIVTINGTFISNYYTAQDYLTATAIQLL